MHCDKLATLYGQVYKSDSRHVDWSGSQRHVNEARLSHQDNAKVFILESHPKYYWIRELFSTQSLVSWPQFVLNCPSSPNYLSNNVSSCFRRWRCFNIHKFPNTHIIISSLIQEELSLHKSKHLHNSFKTITEIIRKTSCCFYNIMLIWFSVVNYWFRILNSLFKQTDHFPITICDYSQKIMVFTVWQKQPSQIKHPRKKKILCLINVVFVRYWGGVRVRTRFSHVPGILTWRSFTVADRICSKYKNLKLKENTNCVTHCYKDKVGMELIPLPRN